LGFGPREEEISVFSLLLLLLLLLLLFFSTFDPICFSCWHCARRFSFFFSFV